MLRFGLIGYGKWGHHHAAAITATTDLAMTEIACATAETAEEARADYPSVPVSCDYRALLALPTVDAVAIVTPNFLHADMAVAALQAGKHVVLEKPMALNLADCARINDAAAQAGRTVSVVHQFRLSTQWGAIKTMVASGEIGSPRYANVNLFRFPFRSGAEGWRYDAGKVGSWILEEAIHFFDAVMWYFEDHGDPTTVTATGTATGIARGAQPGLYDNFSCTLRWANGCYAHVNQSLCGFENHLLTEVTGAEGAVRAWWSGSTDRTRTPTFELKLKRSTDADAETLAIGPSGEVFELAETYSRIGDAFQNNRPLVSGKEAMKCVHVCLEAQRSLETGRTMALAF